jgi:DNA replication and repair protein RecF
MDQALEQGRRVVAIIRQIMNQLDQAYDLGVTDISLFRYRNTWSYLRDVEKHEHLDTAQALLDRLGQHLQDFAAELDIWDEQLAAAAAPLVRHRRWFLDQLSKTAAEEYASIAENPGEPFALEYVGPLAKADDPAGRMLDGLRRSRDEDRRRQHTTFGPHRDDIALMLYGRDLRAMGSQGQLRTAVLSMKLGEIRLIQDEMGEPPALLLDDVFSELDVKRRSALLRSTQGIQTLITCTDRQDAADARADQFLRVSEGADGFAKVEAE